MRLGWSQTLTASTKPEDFYDPRFFNDLRESGFLKKLWGDKL